MLGVVNLPEITAMEPKIARRAWMRFMSDHLWDAESPIYVKAEWVAMSIEMLILNIGDPGAEAWCRKKLGEEFAAFSLMWSQRRGQG